jgi:xylulokinase
VTSHSVEPDKGLAGAYETAYGRYRELYPAVKKATAG